MFFVAAATMATAQTNGSNSPYSRFGLGVLNDQSQGFNKAMSGLSLGSRYRNRINMQNPASYSAIDSLTFLFDVGMSFQNGNFKSGNSQVNAHNASLDYVNAALRLRRGLGLSFGFIPYSTIGYNFSSTSTIGEDPYTGQTITSINNYNGDGGLHQIYIGLGWTPFGGFSIGANISYLWGSYNHSVAQNYYENETTSSSIPGLNKHLTGNIQTYKVDLGAQYVLQFNKDNQLTLGATCGLGHNIKSTAYYYNYKTGGDSTKTSVKNGFDLPYSFGGGAAWTHKKKLMIGADVTYQKWSNCNIPQVNTENESGSFTSSSGAYMDRTKFVIGGEYTPNYMSHKYFNRVQYRLGASFATPYVRINQQDGPKEFGISAGLGLPITNRINNRSVINVSVQWIKTSPSVSSMITENYIRLNVGITFNEKWFMKWKID